LLSHGRIVRYELVSEALGGCTTVTLGSTVSTSGVIYPSDGTASYTVQAGYVCAALPCDGATLCAGNTTAVTVGGSARDATIAGYTPFTGDRVRVRACNSAACVTSSALGVRTSEAPPQGSQTPVLSALYGGAFQRSCHLSFFHFFIFSSFAHLSHFKDDVYDVQTAALSRFILLSFSLFTAGLRHLFALHSCTLIALLSHSLAYGSPLNCHGLLTNFTALHLTHSLPPRQEHLFLLRGGDRRSPTVMCCTTLSSTGLLGLLARPCVTRQ
jgi:hypothetical protein